jgi:putative chitinase
MITKEQLKQILPNCKDPATWAQVLSEDAPSNFNDAEMAKFVAQCGHESMHFNVLQENLNYSGDRLMAIFPKYFRNRDVSMYHRKPELIANVVYANRMANGDIASGDGWKFRGRGIIQLTGRANYTACSQAMFGNKDTLTDKPDLLLEPKYAMGSAFWFWNSNGLCGIDDFVTLTKKINGGTHGLDDRLSIYNRAKSVMCVR